MTNCQHRISTRLALRHPKHSQHEGSEPLIFSPQSLTPLVCSVSRNTSVIHTGTHSRKLRFNSRQLSSPLLLSHQGLQIQSLASNPWPFPILTTTLLSELLPPTLLQDPPSLSLSIHTHSSYLLAQASKLTCFPKWKNQLMLFSSK